MFHKILPVGPLQCNCSVIGDEQTHEAMVIDPGDNVEQILEILKQQKLTLKQIVITHAHIDHIGGAMKLKAATGAALLLNQNGVAYPGWAGAKTEQLNRRNRSVLEAADHVLYQSEFCRRSADAFVA